MADEKDLNVLILTPEKIIFEGKAHSLVLPGEKGVFEVQPFHKRLLSRLVGGFVILDGNSLEIKRGVAKVALNNVTVIVEAG